MLNFRRKQDQPEQNPEPNKESLNRRRQFGPILVAVLFLLAACAVSFNFFADRFFSLSQLESGSAADGSASAASAILADREAGYNRDQVQHVSFGHERSKLPENDSAMHSSHLARHAKGRMPSSDDADTEIAIRRERLEAFPDVNLETKEEDYKISLAPNIWNGEPQLLPNPMFVSQLRSRKRIEIRGGGWLVVDLTQSQIVPVELFKGTGAKAVIEARRLDGREIVTPSNTGFPIVRGISDLRIGKFEVFENPPCLVRFGGVRVDEICAIDLRGARLRYRFEAPVLEPEAERLDNVVSSVSIDTGLGGWLKIASFNENFYPIGDANRDGYPDFFAETITGSDESGIQQLIVSNLQNDTVEYRTYSVPFRSAR